MRPFASTPGSRARGFAHPRVRSCQHDDGTVPTSQDPVEALSSLAEVTVFVTNVPQRREQSSRSSALRVHSMASEVARDRYTTDWSPGDLGLLDYEHDPW